MAHLGRMSPKQIHGNTKGGAAPTANDDNTKGYEAGSLWTWVADESAYICISAGSGTAVWKRLTDAAAVVLTALDKELTAKATVADGDEATLSRITATPYGHGMVQVTVNGQVVNLTGAAGTGDCWFCDPAFPLVARTLATIAAGDRLNWNGSVAGYELSADDRISFWYAT